MYTMTNQIRYSECGRDNKAKLSSIMNYFQDCTSENSERLGVGVEYLKEKKRAWILNTWQVEIERYPMMSEVIKTTTWATGFKGVFGPREFCMETEDGELLARANTLWVYIDTASGRPTKPSEEEITTYGVEPSQEMESVPRKITLPEALSEVDTFLVRKYHIDTNNHVNNNKYIEFAVEVLTEKKKKKKLRVEYKKAAVYGDTIVVKTAVEENRQIVALCDTDGQPYAIVEMIGEQ